MDLEADTVIQKVIQKIRKTLEAKNDCSTVISLVSWELFAKATVY